MFAEISGGAIMSTIERICGNFGCNNAGTIKLVSGKNVRYVCKPCYVKRAKTVKENTRKTALIKPKIVPE